MAIVDLQRRLAEVGRIRIGQQVKSGKGSRPSKLDTFRLTSPDRTRIEQAAKLYGGVGRQWEAPAGGQWEVITTTDQLPVVVPPSDMAFSQFYELWSGGGCQRRCDGVHESISEDLCLCDPDARECKIHSRLSVMLRDLPGLGVWRIDSSGYYAGVELQGAVEVVKLAAGRGQMLPAVLRLEQRQVKRVDEQVKRFAVPVLDLLVTPAQLLGGGDMLDAGTLSIEPPVGTVRDGLIGVEHEMQPDPYFTPVPETVPQQPTRTVKEQTEPPPKKKPRKNAAQSIPPTGLKPRTAAQASKDSSGLTAGKSGERAAGEGMPPPDEPDPGGPPPPPPDDWPHRNPVRDGRTPPSTAAQAASGATKSGAGGTYDSRISDDPWPHGMSSTGAPLSAAEAADRLVESDSFPDRDTAAEVDARTKLNRQMHALFRKAGIEKAQRDDRLAITRYIAKRFDIDTSLGLTLGELENVAETLAQWDRDEVLAERTNELLNLAAIDKWQETQQ